MGSESETLFPRPLSGAQVDPLPSALVPSRGLRQGTQVQLEAMDAALHAGDLYEASHTSDEGRQIWTYLPEGPWPDRDAYTAHVRANSASLERVFYAIRPLPGGAASGQASFMDINAANGVIEIGYIWFAPVLQRTRAATEALYLMLDYALSTLRYRRMQWRCNALNANSRNAARRLGFRFEGIFHNHMIYKGLNRDTAWYSILDDEWPQTRAILREWLDDENFDQTGKSKQSLGHMMTQRSPSQR
jgi:RimJ/RimL family protein N-acetyltransferase